MRFISALICLLLCSVWTWGEPLTKTHAQPRYSDSQIEANIRTKLSKSKIGKEGFQCHVRNGIATWTGSTGVMQHKGAATRMAKTAGASQVVNNIKISDQEKAKFAANLAGTPRRVQVKTN